MLDILLPILGGIGGFLLGGPAGALAGAGIGSSLASGIGRSQQAQQAATQIGQARELAMPIVQQLAKMAGANITPVLDPNLASQVYAQVAGRGLGSSSLASDAIARALVSEAARQSMAANELRMRALQAALSGIYGMPTLPWPTGGGPDLSGIGALLPYLTGGR